MRKIKLLALLVIVAFVVQDLVDMFSGATDGWRAAGDSTEYNAHFDLAVRPTDTLVPDSLQGATNGVKAPYWATRIEGYGRIQQCVLRGSVFTRQNVRRMRTFVYSTLLLGVLFELMSYASYLNVTAHVAIPGYEVAYGGLKYTWLPYLLLALFTEIFAIGVKLKEEQDLTI